MKVKPSSSHLFSHSESAETERGSAAVSILGFIFVLLGSIAILIFFVFGRVVPPNYIGLRQNYYGFPGAWEKGYETEGLLPGLHWKLPFISTIHLFPRDFQFIHFNNNRLRGELSLPVLDVPTTDGSKVRTDVTLVLRFFQEPDKSIEEDGKPKVIKAEVESPVEDAVPFPRHYLYNHGGPRDLVRAYTDKGNIQLSRVSQVTENELRKELSVLSTTDFYNAVLREEAALDANKSANELLNPKGVELWGTLIRRYVYAEKKIDDQIFQKNLQEQTERLNASASRFEAAKAKTEEVAAYGDAKIKDLQVEGAAKVNVVRSEGDLYEAKKISEGDLMVAEAEAYVDKLRASALSSTEGADVYIARELAPILSTLNGGVVTNIDPFDLNAWVNKFVEE